MRQFKSFILFCFLIGHFLFIAPLAGANMTIEISGGSVNRIPIAIAPFAMRAGSAFFDPAQIVADDLNRSGYFRVSGPRDLQPAPADPQQVRFGDWAGKGLDALVVGQVLPTPEGQLEVRFWLYDVVRQNLLAALSIKVPGTEMRFAAHRIADVIFEKLLGVPGDFSSRIAYVLKQNGKYTLQVADADSYNPRSVVLPMAEPIISPVWSPDGRQLAYVSFESKKPVVYVQNVADGRRRVVANFRGSNSSPAWSPDGQTLAVALSREGASQLYLISVAGGEPRRIARSNALDTEPVFSPDGQWLYFTSDRGGTPQIYRLALASSVIERVTYEGGYNVSPALSRDGRKLAFIHRRDGRFHVAVMDLGSRQMQVLTETAYDESPSFSPNGRNILYATQVNGRGVLATVSVDGGIHQRLSKTGDLREPAWAP